MFGANKQLIASLQIKMSPSDKASPKPGTQVVFKRSRFSTFFDACFWAPAAKSILKERGTTSDSDVDSEGKGVVAFVKVGTDQNSENYPATRQT